jgi:hypothetical protein
MAIKWPVKDRVYWENDWMEFIVVRFVIIARSEHCILEETVEASFWDLRFGNDWSVQVSTFVKSFSELRAVLLCSWLRRRQWNWTLWKWRGDLSFGRLYLKVYFTLFIEVYWKALGVLWNIDLRGGISLFLVLTFTLDYRLRTYLGLFISDYLCRRLHLTFKVLINWGK